MTARNIDRAYEIGHQRGFEEGFNARTDADAHCCNIEAVAEAYNEGHADGHDQAVVASEAYREGYKDGLAEPRACQCSGDDLDRDLDAWAAGFNAGWQQGYEGANSNGH